MFGFALAVFSMVITPGPAVLALAGVGAAFSFKIGVRFLIGLTVGYLVVWMLVISGCASIMFSIPFTRIIFLIISTGYLSYLALVIILQGSRTTFIIPKKVPTIKDGIILQLMNPKAYAFHSILFTGFIVFPENFLLETTWKFLLMNLIWIPLHLGWLKLGTSFKKFNLTSDSQKRLNIILGVSLLITAFLSFLSLTQV